MENPHDRQQTAILSRIVANIGKINKSMSQLNVQLEAINKDNSDIERFSHIWTAYGESVHIHLDATNNGSNTNK